MGMSAGAVIQTCQVLRIKYYQIHHATQNVPATLRKLVVAF